MTRSLPNARQYPHGTRRTAVALETAHVEARTFAEICAPIAQVVAAGISDEEFDPFCNEVRKEVWQEKQRTQSLADAQIAAKRREGEPDS